MSSFSAPDAPNADPLDSASDVSSPGDEQTDGDAPEAASPVASSAEEEDDSAAERPPSKVTVGIHFATNRRGRLRARLLRTREGTGETDLSELTEGLPPEEVIVRGRIQAHLNLNALFAEGLFADRSLDEHELKRRAVESEKALVRGKIRADVDLEALFSGRIVEGVVDRGTMYTPPTTS